MLVEKELPSLAFPCFFKSNLFQIDFRGLFGKVRNNKLMHLRLGISPPNRCKDNENYANESNFEKKISKKVAEL